MAWNKPVAWGGVPQALAIGACVSAFVVMLALRGQRFWVFTLDDAFITLRYSAHWAAGLGASWNPGFAPAEGYTTTLWMGLLALAIRVGLDGLLFAKLAGVFFAVAAMALASLLAWKLARAQASAGTPEAVLGRTVAACLPWLMAIAYWPLSLHAISGMETTCSACMLTLFFYLCSVRAQPRAIAVSALLACLARPEAVLACALALLLLALEPKHRRKFITAVVFYAVLPGALYYAWRTRHYGLLFPLSFYVKATGQPPLAGLSDVLEFFALFIMQPWWAALAVLGALAQPTLRPALLGALAFALFFVFPEHIMAFESRYLIPLFPLLAALVGLGAGRAARWLHEQTSPRVALAVVPMILLLLASSRTSPERNVEQWLEYGRGLSRAHIALANAMRATGLHDARVAMLDVGAVGYYADWFTLDTFGLNDAHVALTQRTDVDYVFRQQPDLLVLVSASPEQFVPVFAWEAPLHREATRLGYRYSCDYHFAPDYYLHVLTRSANVERDEVVCRARSHP
jgi:arabinofuranosyltransferase